MSYQHINDKALLLEKVEKQIEIYNTESKFKPFEFNTPKTYDTYLTYKKLTPVKLTITTKIRPVFCNIVSSVSYQAIDYLVETHFYIENNNQVLERRYFNACISSSGISRRNKIYFNYFQPKVQLTFESAFLKDDPVLEINTVESLSSLINSYRVFYLLNTPSNADLTKNFSEERCTLVLNNSPEIISNYWFEFVVPIFKTNLQNVLSPDSQLNPNYKYGKSKDYKLINSILIPDQLLEELENHNSKMTDLVLKSGKDAIV